MRNPHILNASANVLRLKNNLVGILPSDSILKIEQEICLNVKGLFQLGFDHYKFAKRINKNNWRQKTSRFYYGAYNMLRSVRLHCSGEYHTDSTDHKKIDKLPDDFPNKAIYENKLPLLRADRNLADYDHTANEAELVLTLEEIQELVLQVFRDSKLYLTSRGIDL